MPAPDEPFEGRRWILLIYRIKSESSSRRTYVWRQLRQLGAVYLQQAVAVLPDRPELRRELDRLGLRIQSGGGEASFLETTSPTPAWEEELVARFNAARDAEYEEILDSVEGFEDEIRRETRKKRFRFAELEEGEADWEKLQRWFARLTERDFFGARGACVGAEEALARGRALLDTFTTEVYRAEGSRARRDRRPQRAIDSVPVDLSTGLLQRTCPPPQPPVRHSWTSDPRQDEASVDNPLAATGPGPA